MIWKLLPILACFGLIGCVVVLPSGLSTAEMARPAPFVAPETVAALPSGSRVRIVMHSNSTFQSEPDSDGTIEGTVLVASPEGVALKNCTRNVRLNPFSGVGTTYIPVRWVSLEQITSTRVISPPAPEDKSPQLNIVTNEAEFMENYYFAHSNNQGSESNRNEDVARGPTEAALKLPN